MKRTTYFFLVCLILFLLVGCNGESIPASNRNYQVIETAEPDISQHIEMVNVTSMSIADATKILSDKGFINITSNIDLSTDEDRWIVTAQSISSGTKILPDEEIRLTCEKLYQFYIDITSESNLLFSKYDMEVLFDGKELGTVANGDSFSQLVEVFAGDYDLTICKAGNSSVKSSKRISIKSDLTFQCDVAHGSNTIELKNVTTKEDVTGASLEIIDVTNIVLADAINQLITIGFDNIQEEPYSEIWNTNNWIVISQNLSAGTRTDRHTQIVLDCVRTEEYVRGLFDGLTVAEIRTKAQNIGYAVSFINEVTSDNINSEIEAMNELELSDWNVAKISLDSSKPNAVIVHLSFDGLVTIPNLIGKSAAEAEKILGNLGVKEISFVYNISCNITAKSKWIVATQSINEGETTNAANPITLYLDLNTLNTQSSESFAELMQIENPSDPKAEDFANEHIGELVEFDGCVGFMMLHDNYKTRFDILLCNGNYTDSRTYGAFFCFIDVNYRDMNVSGSDSVSQGMNFHIIGKIVRYNSEGNFIEITPVAMIKR